MSKAEKGSSLRPPHLPPSHTHAPSPCPGGNQRSSVSGVNGPVGRGVNVAASTFGKHDWVYAVMVTLWCWYLCSSFSVASWVRNEFITINGTSTEYRVLRTSICRTMRSRKDVPGRTWIADLGPTQPMDVPNPPFSFSTAILFSKSRCSTSDGGTVSKEEKSITRAGGSLDGPPALPATADALPSPVVGVHALPPHASPSPPEVAEGDFAMLDPTSTGGVIFCQSSCCREDAPPACSMCREKRAPYACADSASRMPEEESASAKKEPALSSALELFDLCAAPPGEDMIGAFWFWWVGGAAVSESVGREWCRTQPQSTGEQA